MSDIKRVLKYEAYKISHSKLLMITFAILYLWMFLFTGLIGITHKLEPVKTMTPIEKEQAAAYYEEQRDLLDLYIAYLNGEDVTLPEGTMLVENSNYAVERDFYNFLLETGTFESDYQSTTDQDFTSDAQNSYVMVWLLNVLSYAMPVIAMLLTFYVLNIDKIKGTQKNVCATTVKQKNVILGKFLFIFLTIAALYIVSIAVPMAFGLSNLSPKLLLYNNGYFAQSVFTATFYVKAVSIFISILFWSGVAALFSLMKRTALAAVLPLVVFAAFHALVLLLLFDYNVMFCIVPTLLVRASPLDSVIQATTSSALGWVFIGIALIVSIVMFIVSVILFMHKNNKELCYA